MYSKKRYGKQLCRTTFKSGTTAAVPRVLVALTLRVGAWLGD